MVILSGLVQLAGTRQDLDRDLSAEPRIPRAIDLAHATRAKSGLDLVWTEMGAGNESHGKSMGF
jgi:hypothetical protein